MKTIVGIECACFRERIRNIVLIRVEDDAHFYFKDQIVNIDPSVDEVFVLEYSTPEYSKVISNKFVIKTDTIYFNRIFDTPLICKCDQNHDIINLKFDRFIHKNRVYYSVIKSIPIIIHQCYTSPTFKNKLNIFYPVKDKHNRIQQIANFHGHKTKYVESIIYEQNIFNQTEEGVYKNSGKRFETPIIRGTVNNLYNKEFFFRFFESKIISCIDNAKDSIYIAMYNIQNINITNALIRAHQRGVVINLISSYKCLFAREADSYLSLLNYIDINLIIHGMDNEFDIDNSMHTKFAVFDQQITLTGSVNWESLSSTVNEEVMMWTNSSSVAMKYTNMWYRFLHQDEPYGFVKTPMQIYSTQSFEPLEKIVNFINKAKAGDNIYIAMFIFMKLTLIKRQADIMYALKMASERGVFVNIIVELNTNSNIFGQYYTRKIPENKYLLEIESEWINTKVYRIQTYKGNNKYAAIHHKFIAIQYKTDKKSVVSLGSANFWDISFSSEDDMIIIEDNEICNQFVFEWNMLKNPTFTVNGINLKPTEYLCVVIDKKEYKLQKSSVFDEYYSTVDIEVCGNIYYYYAIKSIVLKDYYVKDINRTKVLGMYRLTDTWGKQNMWDEKFDKILVL